MFYKSSVYVGDIWNYPNGYFYDTLWKPKYLYINTWTKNFVSHFKKKLLIEKYKIWSDKVKKMEVCR